MWIGIPHITSLILTSSLEDVNHMAPDWYSLNWNCQDFFLRFNVIVLFSSKRNSNEPCCYCLSHIMLLLSLCFSPGPSGNTVGNKSYKCGLLVVFVTKGSLSMCGWEVLKTRLLKYPYVTWWIKRRFVASVNERHVAQYGRTYAMCCYTTCTW